MADSIAHSITKKARPSRRALFAFSLVEVCMVLVIIAVVAAIAVPRYAQADARYRLEGAARRIQSDMEMARTLCRADGQVRTVVFDGVSSTYQITASAGGTMAGRATYSVNLADAPYRLSVALAGGATKLPLTIDGYGEARDTGSLSLNCGDSTITLIFGSTVASSGILSVPGGLSVSGVPVEGATELK